MCLYGLTFQLLMKLNPVRSHHDHLQCDLRHKCLLWTLPLWRCMSQLAQMTDFDFYDNNMNDMKPWFCPPDQELIALALDIELIQVKQSRLPLLRTRGLLLLVNLMRATLKCSMWRTSKVTIYLLDGMWTLMVPSF